MTRILGDWLNDRRTRAAMQMLTDAGFQAFYVGGCVRDAIIGRPVKDIDIATDALPDQVIRLAEEAGFKTVPTGIDHGTLTLITDGLPHEITTFRQDLETDGRRAVVAYSTEILDDARRRDFTMNALYASADGEVVDPLGIGLDDLSIGIVRFIDDAEDRIREDYLRILRYFRFHATYGSAKAGPDPAALSAIAQNLDGLDTLSAERITHEIIRLLAAPDPLASVSAMQVTGVLSHVLPGSDPRALGPLVDYETSLEIPPEPIRRLCALGGEDVTARLRLSKKEERRRQCLRRALSSNDTAKVLGYRLGKDDGQDVVVLRAAMSGHPIVNDEVRDVTRGANAEFPVLPRDLMPEFEGAALGARLAALEARWLDSDFELTKDELLRD